MALYISLALVFLAGGLFGAVLLAVARPQPPARPSRGDIAWDV